MDANSLICTDCGKIGHVAKICQASNRQFKQKPGKSKFKSKQNGFTQTSQADSSKGAHHLTAIQNNSTQMSQVDNSKSISDQRVNGEIFPSRMFDLFNLSTDTGASLVDFPEPYMVNVLLDDYTVLMEVDSGATVAVIHRETFEKFWPNSEKLKPVNYLQLDAYTEEKVQILGVKDVAVEFNGRKAIFPVFVVDRCKKRNLMGRHWFPALGISVAGLHSISDDLTIASNSTLLQHPALQDSSEYGQSQDPPVHLVVISTESPKYLRARPVPYAMEAGVVEEIESLVKLGVFKPTPFSKWATPVVVVPKRDGSIRLCGDYKATVNTVLKPDKCPLPTLEDLFVKLFGAKVFSKLDLDQAFTQLSVDDESAELLTLNTIKGLFTVHRLPFGISAAPGVFQRLIEGLLADIEGVAILMDDVLIGGNSRKQYDERVNKVLDRLHTYGLKLKKKKCEIYVSEVEFLGFKVSAAGIHPTKDKIDAILNFPMPTNKMKLQALLGVVNFYDRFFPNRANTFEPLYRLLDKDSAWIWDNKHERAVKAIRDLLSSDRFLAHYDGRRQLVLACDASSAYGIAAVLSHIDDNGHEQPIAFKSRTMSSTERNYAQVDKEALSFIFGVTKFHKFLFGRPNLLFITDHKPLLGIFKKDAPIPDPISPRMLRWSLIINAYDYQFVFRPGRLHGNADAFSRLPLPNILKEEYPDPAGIYLLELQSGPVNYKQILEATQKDETLSEVVQFVKDGWPFNVPVHLKLFHCLNNN